MAPLTYKYRYDEFPHATELGHVKTYVKCDINLVVFTEGQEFIYPPKIFSAHWTLFSRFGTLASLASPTPNPGEGWQSGGVTAVLLPNHVYMNPMGQNAAWDVWMKVPDSKCVELLVDWMYMDPWNLEVTAAMFDVDGQSEVMEVLRDLLQVAVKYHIILLAKDISRVIAMQVLPHIHELHQVLSQTLYFDDKFPEYIQLYFKNLYAECAMAMVTAAQGNEDIWDFTMGELLPDFQELIII